MLVGYARVSTVDQNNALQTDALTHAGCEKLFIEKASGSKQDRPQLKAALDYLKAWRYIGGVKALAASPLAQADHSDSPRHGKSGHCFKGAHAEHRHWHTPRPTLLSHDSSF